MRDMKSQNVNVQGEGLSLLEQAIVRHAHELGFDLVDFCSADRFDREGRTLEEWLKDGFHGSMTYMERAPERRTNPAEVLPGAKSIVVVGLSYYDGSKSKPLKASEGRVARYALGRDYHKTMEKMLKSLAQTIRQEAGPSARTRYYVDTGPVLERAAAKRAGLGFIGKNTHLIHPRLGSWVLLGEVITNIALDFRKPPALPDCGTCRLCIDACPTGAIVEPFKLDARKCISYLTIEERGDIPAALRSEMGEWVFGCDICQDVCPFNHKALPACVGLEEKVSGQEISLRELLNLRDADAFRESFRGRPLLRPKREGLLRNAAIAAGNSGDPLHVPSLTAALKDSSAQVRRYAAWALGRIKTDKARVCLEEHLQQETDNSIKKEIKQYLQHSSNEGQLPGGSVS